MEKHLVKFATDGLPSLLVLTLPDEISVEGSALSCFALPIKSRQGGLLLCIPRGVVSEEMLIQHLAGEDPAALLGPSKLLEVNLCEEDETGEVQPLQANSHVHVVDFSDDILSSVFEYDGVGTEDPQPIAFSEAFPNALPDPVSVVALVETWIAQQSSERVHFYSAREEPDPPEPPKAAKSAAAKKATVPKRVTNQQVMEQLASLDEQMKVLSARQVLLEKRGGSSADRASEQPPGKAVQGFAGLPPVTGSLQGRPSLSLEGVAKSAKMMGPPPKTKVAIEPLLASPAIAEEPLSPWDPAGLDPTNTGLASALMQQSSAITQLVSHLASNSDPFTDLQISGSSAAASTSTKGTLRREKMQADLANGVSTYYLAMMQQVHRRLHPGRPVPKTEAELAAVSFLAYLEKTGGYKGAKEAGLMMWLLGHVADAAAANNMWLVRERLALALVSLEQSVVDSGDWTLGYLLSLAEDPPLTLFQDRTAVVSPFGTPFSPLVPPSWSATLLGYVKELEILTTKKTETSPRKKATMSNVDSNDASEPAPKRKPRFPKRPKGDPPPPK
jgi:hypothetical protein